jgi:hypothetical protein
MSSPLPTSPPSTSAANSELGEPGTFGGIGRRPRNSAGRPRKDASPVRTLTVSSSPRGWYHYGRNAPASHLVFWPELRRAPLGPASAT